MNITSKKVDSTEMLLNPLKKEYFIESFWEKKHLVLRRKNPNHYSNLISRQILDFIISHAKLKYSQMRLAKNQSQSCPVTKLQEGGMIFLDYNDVPSVNQLYSSYAQGETLIVKQIQDYYQPLAKFCLELEEFFHHPVSINSYLTPPHSQGFDAHFDNHDVCILQIDGSKHWRIYGSAVDLPLVDDNSPIPKEILYNPVEEVHLKAGDLLYLPRGVVHEAWTTNVSSFHLTVGIHVFRWADLITEVITSLSRQDVRFRASLPIGFFDSEKEDPIQNKLLELTKIATDQVKAKVGVSQLKKHLIDKMNPLADGHFSCLDLVDNITLDTVVARKQGMICRVAIEGEGEGEGEGVVIQFPGNQVSAPLYLELPFQFIASQDKFPISAIPDILSNNSKLVLVRRLIREGLLTIVKL